LGCWRWSGRLRGGGLGLRRRRSGSVRCVVYGVLRLEVMDGRVKIEDRTAITRREKINTEKREDGCRHS
jgi:hypothetical protein